MRTTNNLFRKVHNYTHFMGWVSQFELKCNIWGFFIIFNILNVFVRWKNGKFQSPKSSTGTSISPESKTTLKSVISSLKICFQNYGQLKRKILRPKNTIRTFLKFELSSLSGPMLKTRKNTIRNQFEIQWFDVISFHKPSRVYPSVWYNLKPFANSKGIFKRSVLHVIIIKGKITKLKIKKVSKFNTFYVQKIRF